MPGEEDIKVRRVLQDEQAWAETLHKSVCTDVWASVNTLREKRHSDCQVGLAGRFFGGLTEVHLISFFYNGKVNYLFLDSRHAF